jgi:hypothetical protein
VSRGQKEKCEAEKEREGVEKRREGIMGSQSLVTSGIALSPFKLPRKPASGAAQTLVAASALGRGGEAVSLIHTKLFSLRTFAGEAERRGKEKRKGSAER